MERNEAHRIARILDGPQYDGTLVDGLIETTARVESFYRPEKFQRVTTVDTPSTPSVSVLTESGCKDCGATYGHKISCPCINRTTAEAKSAVNGRPSPADVIFAHGLGIRLS